MYDCLSEKIGTGIGGGTDRSVRRRVSQVSSATKRRMELYSASAEEREIEACFLDFQEIGEPSKMMNNQLIDRRVSLQEAQRRR